jgi:hypothetical protein
MTRRHLGHRILEPLGSGQDHETDPSLGDQRAHGVGKDRLAREQGHGLGDAGAQPLPRSGGGNDRDDGAGFHGGHATDTNAHRPGSAVGVADAINGSGLQDLVEDGLGLVLVGVLGQGQLADQDLARLAEHALLAG